MQKIQQQNYFGKSIFMYVPRNPYQQYTMQHELGSCNVTSYIADIGKHYSIHAAIIITAFITQYKSKARSCDPLSENS